MDWLKEFLKAILSQEDYEKYSGRLEPPPKKEETTIYQELANKVKEQDVLVQVDHHRNVVRDVEAKLHKQQGLLQELLDRNQILQQEIDTLHAQVVAATNPYRDISPMLPPGNYPAGRPSPLPSTTHLKEDEEMEEVEDVDELGSGVGAFLAPPRKKWRKRLTSRRHLEREVLRRLRLEPSVLAEAGMPSAREPTRLVEQCSALAKEKDKQRKGRRVLR